MSKDTRNYYERELEQINFNGEHPANKLYILGFSLLAVILLPVTCLWACFAYLAGDKEPLFTLRGKNVDEPIDNP